MRHSRTDRGRPAPGVPVVAAVLAAVLVLAVAPLAAGAQRDPGVAPVTTISADGRTGTDGTRTLVVSQVTDLEPGGMVLSVSGSGYDVEKGVYVALCAVPPRNHVPSPCGGGVDTEGTQGAAQWFSSNPPSYAIGLAQPYGPGGTFATSFTIQAEIAPGIDCRQVRCAVVTRNDHTRSSDRSQDILIPVTFRTATATTPPPAAPDPVVPQPGGVQPTTTAPPITPPPLANPTTTAPPPEATVAPDGRSATDGTRTLSVERAAELDPEPQPVIVRGEGYDETRGIYVGLCAITPGEAPGPCRTGSTGANRWVSSNPPEYGVGVASPFGAGGTFEVDLEVAAVIDASTYCRQVACAIVTRADDTAADDRTLDLAIPVTFAATTVGTSAPEEPEAVEVAADEVESAAASVVIDEAPGSSPTLLLVVVAVLAALAVAAALVVRARRQPAAGAAVEAGPSPEPSSPAAPPGSSAADPGADQP